VSLAFELSMTPRMSLDVSPALIAFGELLMLPHVELSELVEDELSANEALERQEAGECPVCRGTWRTRCPVCAITPSRGVVPEAQRAGPLQAESDAEMLRRAVRAETAATDGPLVDLLIDSLDRHGLLTSTFAELAAAGGTTREHVAELVGVVRRCGSPGVGATGVAECLLLQLDALELPDDRLIRAIVVDHLPALARGHFASIAMAIGVGRDDVREALDVIRRRLRPYPAFDGGGSSAAAYVVPDLVILEDADAPGGFRVELTDAMTSSLRALPGRPGSGSARMFLAQLHDRRETLRRVAGHVVAHQCAFLRHGAARLLPLTRAKVAADLDLHESTVSRAVAEKFVLLPDRTTTPLAAFFGSAGGADETLRRLLQSDNVRLSDQQLADLMRRAGYPMARRTVAKRRAQLGFGVAALR
jgi:RNA polymerase sigma-54 factor